MQLVPLWSVHYLPTVDGPSHLYNSSVLLRLLSGEHGRLTDFYQIDWRPNPNWIGHAVMVALLTVLPPLVTEKVFVSAIILLFLYGAWLLAGESAYAFLAFPFVYHQSLQFGFYNYSFAAGLYMLIVSFWWKRRDRPNARTIGWMTVLLLVCYFSHPLPLLIAMMSIGMLWLFTIRERPFRQHVLHLLAFIPASALMFWYYTTQRAVSKPPELRHLIDFIARGQFALTFDQRQQTFGIAIVVLYAVLAIATLWLDRRRAANAFGAIIGILIILYFIERRHPIEVDFVVVEFGCIVEPPPPPREASASTTGLRSSFSWCRLRGSRRGCRRPRRRFSLRS